MQKLCELKGKTGNIQICKEVNMKYSWQYASWSWKMITVYYLYDYILEVSNNVIMYALYLKKSLKFAHQCIYCISV